MDKVRPGTTEGRTPVPPTISTTRGFARCPVVHSPPSGVRLSHFFGPVSARSRPGAVNHVDLRATTRAPDRLHPRPVRRVTGGVPRDPKVPSGRVQGVGRGVVVTGGGVP